MSFVNTLRQWDEAVAYVEKGDISSALRTFLAIEEKISKINYNIGCLHLHNDDFDAAEKAFDSSIGKDEHLAVAFFQRGITFYKKEKFEESLLDFQQTFKELRGNQLIDYKPLGLRYKLYACEVLHNIGLLYAKLGKWEKAQENLLTALNLRTEAKFSHIDQALESILKQKLFSLVEIKPGLLFKPNKNYVAELEKKDYLGKAKVLSSIVPADNFSGFAPLQPQVEDVPSTPKAPEVLRALEGEPHTVLYEFIPETKEELAVLPGNIVFVLQRGTDNWASVIFNERVCCVSMSVPVFSSGCIVKVHFMFTIVICIKPGQPYTAMLQMISTKLKLPASALTETRKKMVALYSYEASTPEDLAFSKGDVITVLSKVNEEWFEGECNGKTGIFPSSFVIDP
uniref:SH3 domain-containing protein n=1 Tax=Pygocentrus nattereri TaxID=42514 RepID=A0A3B4CQZ2_PYGNA